MYFSRVKAVWESIHLSPVDQDNASEEDLEGETVNGYNTSSEEVLPLDVMMYKKQQSLFIIPTGCHSVSAYGLCLQYLLMI